MAATRRRRSRAGYATVNGFPNYVRGWCCMAKSGSMQRGYRDVGYLLAIRVAEFRPVQFNARLWRRLVMGLSGHVRRNEKVAVGVWFKEHYPALMQLIPDRRHREFVAGFIERTREEFELAGKEKSMQNPWHPR